MFEFIKHIQFSNAFMCMILALYLLTTRTRHTVPTRLLGLNYFLFATQSILLICVLHQIWPTAAYIRPLIAVLLAPLFYLYALSVYRIDKGFSQKDGWHFLPVLGVLMLLFFSRQAVQYLDGFIIGSYCVYLVLVMRQLVQGSRALKHLAEYAPHAYRWLLTLSLLMCLNVAVEIAVYFELNSGVQLQYSVSLFIGSVAFMIVNTVTVLASLQRITMLSWMVEVSEKAVAKIATPALSEQELQRLFTRWQKLVKQEKLCTREFGITLQQAARKLAVPTRHLSNAVNYVYGGSFSQYLNDLRIEEVKLLFAQRPHDAITDIMFDAGFATKSNFNKEFIRVLGMSPSQYRNSIEHKKTQAKTRVT